MPVKPMRADALRNRERLLATALSALSEDPAVSLDAIAKRAGFGIGTLYRHFPTREALVEAVYRNEVGRLCDSAAELAMTLPADEAMRRWMDRFAGYLATKRGLAEALRAAIASDSPLYAEARERLHDAIETLLTAGVAAGTLRADITAGDVLVSLSGISLAAGTPRQREQAGRLLDLLMDGLRAGR
jgi:AcrR family transcriptional regulator